jgi:hypothetical protein
MKGYSVVNVYGIVKRKKKKLDTTSSDAWAASRFAELVNQGIQARLIRQRREPLCVCYELHDAEAKRWL